MNTIWKYQVPLKDNFVLELPMNAKILSFQTQDDVPYIWVLLDPDNDPEKRVFRLAGTGHLINHMPMMFIGTVQMRSGSLVYHLFEVL